MKNNQSNNRKTAQISSLNNLPHNYPFTQICQTDNLCFSRKLGDIVRILDVSVNICNCRFKTIITPAGKTLIVDAIKIIKLAYTNHTNLNVDCVKFKIPICLSIPLKDINHKIENVTISVQNISYNQLNNSQLCVSMVILAYPIFENKSITPICNNTSSIKAITTNYSNYNNVNQQLLANVIVLIIILKFFNNRFNNSCNKRLC